MIDEPQAREVAKGTDLVGAVLPDETNSPGALALDDTISPGSLVTRLNDEVTNAKRRATKSLDPVRY